MFKIDPVADDEDEEDDHADSYVTYVFHPVFPFAISSICNPSGVKLMKFFFR